MHRREMTSTTGFTPCCGGRRNSSAPGKGLMRNLAIIIVCKKKSRWG